MACCCGRLRSAGLHWGRSFPLKATHEQQVTDLYAEIGRLTTELSWLKKKLP